MKPHRMRSMRAAASNNSIRLFMEQVAPRFAGHMRQAAE